MLTGIAASLLVFTGVWHATEWMMDGRRRDTWQLVPAGLIYLMFGVLLVGSAGLAVQALALASVVLGGAVAYLRRHTAQLRGWVTWVFIGLYVVIAACLLGALLT